MRARHVVGTNSKQRFALVGASSSAARLTTHA